MTDKCIWVVGASSGIGKALALKLAQNNNFVIASARNRQALDALSIAGKGRIQPLPFDVTCSGGTLLEVRSALSEITDYVDIVIYCAGICEYEDSLEFDPDMYQRVMDVNFTGAIKTLHLVKPLLVKSQHRPTVVLVGSLSSELGLPRAQAYGASKAALEYFAKALRADCADLPLRIKLVRPGFVDTPLTASNDFAMPWMMSVDAAAEKIASELNTKKFKIDFPLRLTWSLKLMNYLPGIWFKWIAPKISRHKKSSWA